MKNTFQKNRPLFVFLIGLLIVCILIGFLWQPLLPFFIGFLIAYLFLPIIDWLDNKLPFKDKGREIKRILLILVTFIIVLALVALAIFLTFSAMSQSFSALPAVIGNGLENLGKWLDSQIKTLNPAQQKQVYDAFQSFGASLGDWLQKSFTSGLPVIFSTFTFILGFFTLPFFLIFFMSGIHDLKKDFYSIYSEDIGYHIRNFFKIMNDVFGKYIRAQFIIAIVIGAVVTGVLYLLGIGLAPALGFIAGIFQLIPTIGGAIAAVIGILVTFAIAPAKILWVIIAYIVVNFALGSILIAKLSGSAVRMHPAIIMILIVVGGYLGSVIGMILIVPVVAVIWALYKYARQELEKSKLEGTSDLQ